MLKAKFLGFSVATTLLAAATLAPATAVANDGMTRLATNLCESAKSNDRRTMRKKLDAANLRLNKIYDGLNCGNSGHLLRVATQAGSMDAAKYILTKAKSQALSQTDKDGLTIIQFTEKLVAGGDASKQPFLELYKSKS